MIEYNLYYPGDVDRGHIEDIISSQFLFLPMSGSVRGGKMHCSRSPQALPFSIISPFGFIAGVFPAVLVRCVSEFILFSAPQQNLKATRRAAEFTCMWVELYF